MTQDIGRLSARDLYVISGDGEPCVRDVRLAGRLRYSRPEDIRQLIAANREEFEDYGPLRCRTVKSTGGRPAEEYWLNEGQLVLACFLSRASNARPIRKEVIEAFLAYRRGAQPATPLTDALLEPSKPTIEHDDNVLHVKHEAWWQAPLFESDDANRWHLGDPIAYDASTDTHYDPPLENRLPGPPLNERIDRDSRGLPKTPPWSRGTYDASARHLDAICGMAHGVDYDCDANREPRSKWSWSTWQERPPYLTCRHPVTHQHVAFMEWPLQAKQLWRLKTNYNTLPPSAELWREIAALLIDE